MKIKNIIAIIVLSLTVFFPVNKPWAHESNKPQNSSYTTENQTSAQVSTSSTEIPTVQKSNSEPKQNEGNQKTDNCKGYFREKNNFLGKLMDDPTAVVTLALVLVTLLLVCVTFWQVRLFRKELILGQRPKLRVRNVVVGQPRPTYGVQPEIFEKGTLVRGQFYVDNIGGTDVHIIESGCWVIWSQDRLPMERPYEGKNGKKTNLKLAPGGSIFILFSSDKTMGNEGARIKSGEEGWHLYVMGWLEYIDDLRIKRRTAFCREYSASEGRFITVDNTDYEHEN